MQFDALIHMTPDEAEKILRAEGYQVLAERTGPPKRPIEGEERVARIRKEENTVVITIATYVKEL